MLTVLIILILMSLTAAVIYASYVAINKNFHPITAGEAYRSAQMNGDELTRCIKSYNIKSIINLNGKVEQKWHKDETNICAENKVKLYDLSLSSHREPTVEEVQTLIVIYKSAPRPALIHCEFGADRTGLAAAMWKVIVDKEPKDEAGKQLSIIYGHLSVGPASVLDRFFRNWHPD